MNLGKSCFDVAKCSYDRAEIYELLRIHILTRLATITKRGDCGIYRDEGLLILRNVNR